MHVPSGVSQSRPKTEIFGRRPERDLKHQRDQVSLGIVVLPALLRRTRRIEVAQGGGAEAVGLLQPAQRPLEEQLRFPVRAARDQRRRFVDRHPCRLVEEVRRGRQDEPPHAGVEGRLEQVKPHRAVLAEVLERLLHRFADHDVAAKCMIASGRNRPRAARAAAGSVRSAWMNSAPEGTAARWP
jgi:hypothetical protein